VSLRRVGAKARDVAVGLGLIVAISFVPPSMTAEWPDLAQRAMAITRDIRALVLDLGGVVLEHGGAWLSATSTELAETGGTVLTETLREAGELDLGAGLPGLGDLLPEPRRLFGDLLGGLVEDWWPQPTLPVGGGELPLQRSARGGPWELRARKVCGHFTGAAGRGRACVSGGAVRQFPALLA